jgi:hypothetical protein
VHVGPDRGYKALGRVEVAPLERLLRLLEPPAVVLRLEPLAASPLLAPPVSRDLPAQLAEPAVVRQPLAPFVL